MERFVYTSRHLDALKKHKTMKIIFLLLGCLTLLLQSVTWLIVWLRDMEVSVSDMWFVGITLVYSLCFVSSQVFFAIRGKYITKNVKEKGEFTTLRVKMRFSDKSTIAGGLVVLCRIIAILFVILLAILTVSFIQNYLNWGKVILKMPLMVLIAVGFLNLSADLRYQTMLEKC